MVLQSAGTIPHNSSIALDVYTGRALLSSFRGALVSRFGGALLSRFGGGLLYRSWGALVWLYSGTPLSSSSG